jgi:hypothetical protein
MWDIYDFSPMPKTRTTLTLDVQQQGFEQVHELTDSSKGKLSEMVEKQCVVSQQL